MEVAADTKISRLRKEKAKNMATPASDSTNEGTSVLASTDSSSIPTSSKTLVRTRKAQVTGDPCSSNELNFCMQEKAVCLVNPDSTTGRGYDCICKDGYLGDGIRVCVNEDECADNYPCAPVEDGGFCEDRDPDSSEAPTMYKCGCRQGFELPVNGLSDVHGPLECVAIDFCARAEDPGCNIENATCVNTDTGFSCQCNSGFTGDGKVCTSDSTADDKTDLAEPCDSCDPVREICGPDNYCVCADGFFSASGVGGACQDRQECSTGLHDCDTNANCVNLRGSYLCFCHDGFEGNGKTCSNIDECSVGTHNCGENTDCIDSPGSFSCACSDGYEGDPLTGCTDQNECSTGADTCDEDKGVCTNIPGSYVCSCEDGYELRDGSLNACFDQNECTLGLDNCEPSQICVNTAGNYTCVDPPPVVVAGGSATCTLAQEPAPLTGITKMHNDLRLAVSPPAATPLPCLKWNTELAKVAQDYADQCDNQHNPNRVTQQTTFSTVGENLGASTVTDLAAFWPTAVTGWHNEVSNYNFTANSCSAVCGHYTQIVWAGTTEIGCGITSCPNLANFPAPNAVFLVCNYGEAGNFIGQRPYVAA